MKPASNQDRQKSLVWSGQDQAEEVSSHLSYYPNAGGGCHLWTSFSCKKGHCVSINVKPCVNPPAASVPQHVSSIKWDECQLQKVAAVVRLDHMCGT